MARPIANLNIFCKTDSELVTWVKDEIEFKNECEKDIEILSFKRLELVTW